jgi:translation initiation factor IF-1
MQCFFANSNKNSNKMEKQIKMYNGDLIVRYTETEEKKQRLWDAFIKGA